jgi:hypothetical protein
VRIGTGLALLFVWAASAAAGSTGLLSVQELTARADLVLIGRVAEVASAWNAARTMIHTDIDLLVEEVLKGPANVTGRVGFRVAGGRVGDAAGVVADTPSFAVHEHVLVFLSRKRDGSLGLVEAFQGKFSIEQDDATGAGVAVRRSPGRAEPLDRLLLEQAKQAVRAR